MKILGVLAGEDMPLDQLKRWADSADVILAADSGADRLLAAGSRFDALIGDLDSATGQAKHSAPTTILNEDQESTDCDKLLQAAQNKGYSRITLASIEGSLPDHMLATLQSAAKSPLTISFALRRGTGRIIKAREAIEISSKKGTRISLIPLTDCEGLDFNGVQWPLQNVTRSPLGATSISNIAEGESVRIYLEKGVAFLFHETGPHPQWQ